MTLLPELSPTLTAPQLERTPPRLLKRAGILAEDMAAWQITTEPLTVTIGDITITLTDEGFTCSCLLSPRCAHIAAICLTAPLATVLIDATSNSTAVVEETETVVLSTKQRTVVDNLDPVLAEITAFGLSAVSVAGYARLLSTVQAARAQGLHRLERQLTALARTARCFREGQPVGRKTMVDQVIAVLYTCHLLRRQLVEAAAVGTARRAYHELATDAGHGAGSFIPLFAEPVISDTGFAGVSITLLSGGGEVFQVSRTPPGERERVLQIWRGPAGLGDLKCSLEELSQHQLLLSGGRASADGRLGTGKGVRAAQGSAVTLSQIQEATLPPEVSLITGIVEHADLSGVQIAGHHYGFLATARKLGVTGLVSQMDGREVTVLVRDNTIMACWLGGSRILPGLDQLEVKACATASVEQRPRGASTSVRAVLQPWLERVISRGAPALLERRAQLSVDIARLQRLEASIAAQLLQNLGEKPEDASALLAAGIYLDGPRVTVRLQ